MIYFMNTRIHDPLFGYTYGDNELALISYFTSDEEDKIERVVFPELGEEEFNIHNMDSYPGSSTSLFYNKLNQEIDDKYKVHYFNILSFSDSFYDSGYQHTTFILEDDIEITGTDNELFKLYLENGLIQINNKKIDSKSFPIKLKKGEILQVQVGLDNIFPPYYMINGSITFIAKNKEGKEEKINIDVMDSINKEFTKKQVEDLKKLRGIK